MFMHFGVELPTFQCINDKCFW